MTEEVRPLRPFPQDGHPNARAADYLSVSTIGIIGGANQNCHGILPGTGEVVITGELVGGSPWPTCDICGYERHDGSKYGDWTCPECGQLYRYDEAQTIVLTPRQLELLRAHWSNQ